MPGPICIIGMHRSGTSMIANLLRSRGLSLGPDEHLLGVNESNPFGHFEHIGFLKINEALLKHLGGSWDNPPHLHQGWEQDPALDTLTSEARLLINDFADCSIWGWKDPRTTILLQFWQKIIPNLRYVICIRNPLEVALSLAQRDGVSVPAAAYLWRQYISQAIDKTKGHSRILTFYEDYFRQPIQEVNRVSEFCGLRNDGDPSEIQRSISRDLRHQIGGTVELLNERSVSIEDKLLYFLLRTLSLDNSCVIDRDDTARDGLSSVLRLLYEFHDQEKMLQLETAVGEKEHELNAIRMLMREESRKRDEELRQKDDQIAQLQEHNSRLQVFADAVRQTVAYRLYRVFLKPFRGDASQKT
jgi:hypothetical protein